MVVDEVVEPIVVEEPVIAEESEEAPKVTVVTATVPSEDFVTETVTPIVAVTTPAPAAEDVPMSAEAAPEPVIAEAEEHAAE